MVFAFGILKIKWNNYSFTLTNGLCFLFSFACLTAYQFIVIILDDSSTSYFGYSTVFLNANQMTIILAIFLNSGIKGGSISDLIMNLPRAGGPLDKTRN
jgi:hypothetical protein